MAIGFLAYLSTSYYPYAIALVFLGTLGCTHVPQKGAFAGRALVALVISIFLAHFNRIFLIYPSHPLFPSGHTTFCFGVALSLGLLRPWTLALTLPLLAFMAVSLVTLGYHTPIDVAGAFPLVIIIYGIVHYLWRLPSDSPLLDRARVSA